MAGLYRRIYDPNMAAPVRGGTGANTGIGAPAPGRLPDPPQDDFNPAQLAGLLGMMQKKKEEPQPAAPGAAPGAEPQVTPVVQSATPDMAYGKQLPQGQVAVDNPIAGQQNIADAATGWGKDLNGNPIQISSPEAVQAAQQQIQAGVAAAPQVAAENPGLLDMIRNGWQGLTGLFSAGA